MQSKDGSLQPVKGVLPIAIKASEAGFSGFILPKSNAKEAAIVKGLNVLATEHISEVINFFDKNIPKATSSTPTLSKGIPSTKPSSVNP
jgi:magnesium chelatase family protein